MSREKITTSLDIELLKKFAIDPDRNADDLIEEGMKYILNKHELKVKY